MERRWITNWSVRWPPTSGSDSPIYNGTPLLTYPGGGAVTGSLSLSGILRDRQGGGGVSLALSDQYRHSYRRRVESR